MHVWHANHLILDIDITQNRFKSQSALGKIFSSGSTYITHSLSILGIHSHRK